MTTTPHLSLTLVEQSQAQKEVTVNTALAAIDALLNTGAIDKDLSTPPGSPATGDVYIVAASPTGDWSGQAGNIAYFDQTWRFVIPREGMSLWVNDEDLIYTYTGSAWAASTLGESNTASNLGSGDGLFSAKVGVDLQFKSLVAGSNITLTPASDSITIDASGGSGSGDVTGQSSSVDGEIALFSSTTGKVIKRATGTGFVKATSGVFSTESAVDVSGSDVTGTLAAGRFPALTGDVTTTAGSLAATIATNGVSNGKFRQSAANALVGNPTGSTANVTDITLGSTLAFSSGVLQTAAHTGDVTTSANSFATTIAGNAVSNAKFRQGAGLSVVGVTGSSTANVADITGTANQVLVVNGGGTALAFGQVNLASSGAVTGTLASGNGGTGNAFTAFSGPASSAKTFTLPNASDTVACLGQANAFTKQQYFSATSLTDGATISWDASANQVAGVTLGGNRTLANPSNLVNGGTYVLIVKQDGTGSRTLAYGTAYKWPGGTAPTLTTAASAVDILSFVSDGTNMYGVSQLNFY